MKYNFRRVIVFVIGLIILIGLSLFYLKIDMDSKSANPYVYVIFLIVGIVYWRISMFLFVGARKARTSSSSWYVGAVAAFSLYLVLSYITRQSVINGASDSWILFGTISSITALIISAISVAIGVIKSWILNR